MANNLKPFEFVKGKSGNPGGRPKGLASRVRAETQDGETLVKFFRGVLEGQIKAQTRDRIEAGKWLADRGWGKSVDTTVQVSLDSRQASSLALTPEALKALADSLRPPQGQIVEGQVTVMDTSVRALAPIPAEPDQLPE